MAPHSGALVTRYMRPGHGQEQNARPLSTFSSSCMYMVMLRARIGIKLYGTRVAASRSCQ